MENIIFYKTSEEYKAIKRLEEMTKNYSLNSEDLHYAIILYYLIINLQKQNEELQERIKKYEDPEDLTLMFMYCDEKAKDKIKKLKEQVIIMEKYLELITDLALDYDGCNTIESLKGLIDELDRLACLGRVCNVTETIYVNNNKAYNILHQELEKVED